MNDVLAFTDSDHQWMQRALQLAQRAEEEGEVPVGSVIVHDEQCVGEGWNRNITLNDPSAHAEILAMRDAGHYLSNYRLPGCTMFVTLEPCAMCFSAAIHARLDRLVFGAGDPKTGALGGAYDLASSHHHNHKVAVQGGLMAEQAAEMLRAFFRHRR